MDKKTNALMKQLLQLPAYQRYQLAEALFASLSDEEQDDALEEELDKRWNDVMKGKVKLLPIRNK